MRSLIILRRIAAEQPLRCQPIVLHDLDETNNHDEAKTPRRKKRKVPLGQDEKCRVASKDNDTVRTQLQDELNKYLRPAHRAMSDGLVPWLEDIAAVSDEVLTQYDACAGRPERLKLLEGFFDKAMAEDTRHLNIEVYTKEMTEIRVLAMFGSIRSQQSRNDDLHRIITLLETRLSQQPALGRN